MIGILIQVIIITVPALAEIFKVYSLTAADWLTVILISIVPFAINEIFKVIKNE